MILLTGGTGMIGSCFLAKLNAEGVEDVLVTDAVATSDKWKNLLGKHFVDYLHKDELTPMLADESFGRRIRAVVHLGAISYTTETDFDVLMRDNLHYTQTLAEFAIRNNARFIYASSGATYGDGEQGFSDDPAGIRRLRPINRYGFSKHLFDLQALRGGLLDKIVGLKFFNVYGPNEFHKTGQHSAALAFYKQIKAGGKVRLFRSLHPDYADGEQKRDFVYIKDCLDVMWWLLSRADVNGLYNVGTGKARTWRDMAQAVFNALGVRPDIEFVDLPEQLRGQYQYFTEARMDRLAQAGWTQPMTSLEAGVADYVQNYLEKPVPYM